MIYYFYVKYQIQIQIIIIRRRKRIVTIKRKCVRSGFGKPDFYIKTLS